MRWIGVLAVVEGAGAAVETDGTAKSCMGGVESARGESWMMNAVAVRRMRKDAAMIMETRQYSLPSVRFRWHSPAFTRLYVFPECNAGECWECFAAPVKKSRNWVQVQAGHRAG